MNLIHSSLTRHDLTDSEKEETDITLAREANQISSMLESCHSFSLNIAALPEPMVPEELLAPFDHVTSPTSPAAINFEPLVQLRFAHQREQARTGVRRYRLEDTLGEDSQSIEITTKSEPTGFSIKQKLLSELNSIIHNLEEKGVCTALGRTVRLNPGRIPTSGNSANAKEAAVTRSKNVRHFTSVVYYTSKTLTGRMYGLGTLIAK